LPWPRERLYQTKKTNVDCLVLIRWDGGGRIMGFILIFI
jgi:hypothetical protein